MEWGKGQPKKHQRSESNSGDVDDFDDDASQTLSTPPITGRTRTLIVSRDPVTGYGLTLSGDQPVFVQTVKPGGAADRAGVKENDLILKVNGQPVITDASHNEVVAMIQAGKYVALTVQQPTILQQSRDPNDTTITSGSSPPPPPPIPPGGLIPGSRLSAALSMTSLFGTGIVAGDTVPPAASSLVSKLSLDTIRITAPQPPNTEAIRALTDEKLHTMNLMVEQERRNVESLRQELAAASGASSTTSSSPSHDQRQQELDQAVRRLTKLEEQLEGLKAGKATNRPQSTILPGLRTPPPIPSPSTSSPISMITLTGPCNTTLPISETNLSSPGHMKPPPLPARNRSSMISLPTIPSSSALSDLEDDDDDDQTSCMIKRTMITLLLILVTILKILLHHHCPLQDNQE